MLSWVGASDAVSAAITKVREQVVANRVFCAVSGGVDSTVTATLIHRAIGKKLTCIFVNHGLLRQGEVQQVIAQYAKLDLPLLYVNAEERFLSALAGVTDGEEKRRIIGEMFIRVFEQTMRQWFVPTRDRRFLAQGTIKADVMECEPGRYVKSQHNTGGLPPDIAERFELVEPVRDFFKNEVREIGLALGLPAEVLHRQPFPGPGLAARIVGEVTRERLDTLRAADAIVTSIVEAAGMSERFFQYFAVLLPINSTGVRDGVGTSGQIIVIRVVESVDAMTASWGSIFSLLGAMSYRITSEVPGINRVLYDVTDKPPACIEFV